MQVEHTILRTAVDACISSSLNSAIAWIVLPNSLKHTFAYKETEAQDHTAVQTGLWISTGRASENWFH